MVTEEEVKEVEKPHTEVSPPMYLQRTKSIFPHDNYGEFMVLYNRKLTSFQLARWLSSQRHTTDRVMRSGRSSNQS